MNRLTALTLFSLLLVHFGPFQASAQTATERSKKVPTLTQEERIKHAEMLDKMAEAHKKLAECLRSDKTTVECHEEMIRDCPMAHENHCPMVEEMHFFHRMHRHHQPKTK